MRAIVVSAYGGPEELRLEDAPSPRDGQGLVDVRVAGVNLRDIYERERPGYGPGDPPFVAGVAGVGAVGPGVRDLEPGARVAWLAAFGSYAERVVVPHGQVVPVPDDIDDDDACATDDEGATAHYLTHSACTLKRGDTVLNHAAAGGFGLLVKQIVKNLIGGHVIGTKTSESKGQLAREAGADEVLHYADVPQGVRDITDGRGVAVAYDGVDGSTCDAGFDARAPRGVGILIAAASGTPAPVPHARLAAKSLFVTRPPRSHYTATREELLGRIADLFDWVRAGKLSVLIGGRYPLAEARRAQEDLASRRTTGKLLLLSR